MKFENIMLYSKEKSVQKMLEKKADLLLLDERELEECKEGKLEILDIYDEEKKRIGAASRKACIELGLITRAVHIFVFNKKGEVFLQKRSQSKDTYPGFYAPSASGHIGIGEESEESAKRELEEELGIQPHAKYLGTFGCFKPENAVNQLYDFYVAISNEEIKINEEEIQEGEWVSLKQLLCRLDKEKFVPALKHEIRLFLKDMIAELKRNKLRAAI